MKTVIILLNIILVTACSSTKIVSTTNLEQIDNKQYDAAESQALDQTQVANIQQPTIANSTTAISVRQPTIDGTGFFVPSPISAKPKSLKQQIGEKYQRYIELANTSPAPRKQVYQLLAAQQLNNNAKFEEAKKLIDSIDFTLLKSRYRYNFALLKAELYSAFGEYDNAIKALNIVGFVSGEYDSDTIKFLQKQQLLARLTRVEKLQWLNYRAKFLQLLSNYEAAVLTYIEISQYLDSDNHRIINNQNLWECLNQLDKAELSSLLKNSKTELLTGWLKLYQLTIDNYGGIEEQIAKIAKWKQQYSKHPAIKNLPEAVTMLDRYLENLPKTIAIALPTSGPLMAFGQAIQDGIMATFYELRADNYQVPNLIFLDTATVPSAQTQTISMRSLYEKAINARADIFIGPLDKNRVAELAAINTKIPILALNSIEQLNAIHNSEAAIYQLSLAVESEIEQIITEMEREKVYRILAISDDSDFGARAINALVTNWQSDSAVEGFLQKQVVDVAYLNSSKDYKSQLSDLLLISQSQSRRDSLAKKLGKSIAYTHRRRQDIDAIFLSLNPAVARQIMPLIGFFLADDLKVYATSNIYSGITNKKLDNDLNKIKFVVMPWLVDNKDPVYKKLAVEDSITSQQIIFYAIGVDAFNLSQRITQLSKSANVFYHGAVGTISILPNHSLKKVQTWAKFVRGEPQIIRKN